MMGKIIVNLINTAVAVCLLSVSVFAQTTLNRNTKNTTSQKPAASVYKNNTQGNPVPANKGAGKQGSAKGGSLPVFKEWDTKALYRDIELPSDNTRVQKPLVITQDVSGLVLSARIIVQHNDLYTADGVRAFSYLAEKNISAFLKAAGPVGLKGEDGELLFSAVLPKIYHFAIFKDAENYVKITKLYINAYEACIKGGSKAACDVDRAGYAFLFLNSIDTLYKTDFKDIVKFLNNPKISEDKKIIFMQYAAPVMAHGGAKVYFEEVIKNTAAKYSVKPQVTSGYFDPFILVSVIDNSYQWIKKACTHRDGFAKGACATWSSKKLFKEYMTPVRPKSLDAILGKEPDASALYVYVGETQFNEPAFLASSIRLYAEFYSEDIYWRDTFKYINDLSVRGNNLTASHADIALAKLVINNQKNIPDAAGIKKYLAARINNHYFTIEANKEMDAELKASLKNELGSAYAELTGYTGKSPLTYISDEGFNIKIDFVDNEKKIETFFGSMFNFKERPGEAAANLFIVGLATKGIAKHGDKILLGLGNLFKTAGRVFNNMPAVISGAKAHYKLLTHLASRNNMSVAKYAYKNLQYGRAASTAAKNGIITVEGKAGAEFFANSRYSASLHGDIGRINRDIKKAASAGIQHLGKGGTVPSFVSQNDYQGFLKYTDDLIAQQRIQQSLADKYKTAALTKYSGSAKTAEAVASIDGAAFSLPRKYLYSFNKSQGLALAQNAGYSEGYNFLNKAYGGLLNRGIVFYNTQTGVSFGSKLIFHPQGYLQAHNKIGVIFDGAKSSSATAYLLGGQYSYELFLRNSKSVLNGVRTASVKQLEAFNTSVLPAFKKFTVGGLVFNAAGTQMSHFGHSPKRLMPPSLNSKNDPYAFYKQATFKIMRADGNSGSGSLVNYRGLPVILTSAHVVRDDGIVSVSDYYGNTVTGTVFNKIFGDGYDIAAILVDNNYLAGRSAFKLSAKEPQRGDLMLQNGYPLTSEGTQFKTSYLYVLDGKFAPRGAAGHSYLTTAENMSYGSSGGPLSYGAVPQDKLAGITHAITSDEQKALFLSLPKIKSFLTNTVRRMLFEEPFNTSILPLYPQLSQNYKNILENHRRTLERQERIDRGESFEEPIRHSRLISTDGNDKYSFPLGAAASLKNGFERSVVRISSVSHGQMSQGSGFYLSYRGLPFIITASHVPGENEVVNLMDNGAMMGFGRVFAKTPIEEGRDLALILPDTEFLKGKKPFALSLKEPEVQQQLVSLGYPSGKGLTEVLVKLVRTPHNTGVGYDREPYYAVQPGVLPGTSGGPLLNDRNKIVGLAQKSYISTYENSKSEYAMETYFITMPVIKKFLSTTFINKFMDNSFNQQDFLVKYPALAQNYANVIQKYKADMGNYNVTVPTEAMSIEDILDYINKNGDYDPYKRLINFIPATPEYIKHFSLIRRSVFEIENPLQGIRGTGFYLRWGNNEALLSAGHNAYNTNTVLVRPYGTDKWFNAKVAGKGRGAGNDLALLEVSERGFWRKLKPLTPYFNTLQKGETLTAYGFPWSASFEDRVGIFSEYDLTSDGPVIITSENTAPGSSGGPLLYGRNLAGMSVRGFTQEDYNALPWYAKGGKKAFSAHLPWWNIERFLNIMRLWTLPPSLRSGVDFTDYDAVKNFLEGKKIFLNPKKYNIQTQQPVIFVNPYENPAPAK